MAIFVSSEPVTGQHPKSHICIEETARPPDWQACASLLQNMDSRFCSFDRFSACHVKRWRRRPPPNKRFDTHRTQSGRRSGSRVQRPFHSKNTSATAAEWPNMAVRCQCISLIWKPLLHQHAPDFRPAVSLDSFQDVDNQHTYPRHRSSLQAALGPTAELLNNVRIYRDSTSPRELFCRLVVAVYLWLNVLPFATSEMASLALGHLRNDRLYGQEQSPSSRALRDSKAYPAQQVSSVNSTASVTRCHDASN